MGFGDVSTAAGVKALNDFLAERAYVEGFVPSQVDVAVFEAMGGKAPGADMAHALRYVQCNTSSLIFNSLAVSLHF